MSQTSDETDKRIKRAWDLRFRGRNRDAENLLVALEKSKPKNDHTRMQVSLLRASLLRAHGDLAKSDEILRTISDLIEEKGWRPPFQYYLQKALNLFVVDEFSPALEFFLLADSVAASDDERMACLMNTLVCLDNLNLPLQSVHQQLDVIARRLEASSEDAGGIFIVPVRRQLVALEQRRMMRAGRFRELFSSPLENEMDQSQFDRLWASRLPFVKAKLDNADRLLQKLVLDDRLHIKNYRLKTILADPRIHNASKEAVTTPQQVDRLYLWTWYWLSDPSESNRANLAECLRSFDFGGALKRMTFEDFQMVKNALSWIGLFQKSLAPGIETYLQRFAVRGYAPFALFEYEGLLIEHLKAAREHRTDEAIQARLKNHPLARAKDLCLREMVGRWRDEFAAKSNRPRVAGAVLIDEETDQITTRGQVLISPPIARILSAVARQGTLSFAEALWLGFEISPYDAEVHQAKIHNCLARIKDILPRGTSLKSKNAIIYWHGRRELVQNITPLAHERRLFDDVWDITRGSRVAAKRVFERPMHPRLVLSKASGRKVLSRDELQELMALSKASATRWIQKWQHQGLIRRLGDGRSTRYLFNITNDYRLNDFV